jgi:CheY-like chemotaxis protein
VIEVRWQHFQIRDIYDRMYVDYAPLAHAKGLLFELPTCKQVVYSDPYLLERMLRNLISNAVRYTLRGGVKVECECLESTLNLKIVDSGIGMSEESTRHIFDEYFQVANPQRDRSLGLGLGLSIVKRIESLLGYKIEVTSELDKGSVFAFSVALGDATQTSQAFVANTASHDLNGVTVALVEDDREIRHTVAELMTQWGCRVTAGAMPDEVMGKMEAQNLRPDILVCDYRLPEGVTALHALKLMHGIWDADIPTLVLTGDTEPQTLAEIQGSGALLLHKPIRPARLRAIMYFALHGEN